MKIDLQTVIVAAKDQLSSSIGGETVILGLHAGHYYGVGDVGARVWQLIQEPRRVADIHETIVAEYEVEPGVCETDLLKLLDELAAARLVEVRTDPAP